MKKIIRKSLGALLIVAALVLLKVPAGSASADETVQNSIADFDIVGETLLKYTGTDKTVSVPDSIKVIGDEAFANNTFVEEVKLPKNIEKISYASFSGCSNLKKINIPSEVEEISSAAFCNCKSLSSFTFGSNVKRFGNGVFAGCTSLTSVTGNKHFKLIDGAIYDDEVETLYEVLPSAVVRKSKDSNDYVLLTSYKMPSTVSNIKPYAFYGCKNISEVFLSSNLLDIPAYAFSYCNALPSIKIPFSVSLIDMKAFEYCLNLSDVTIPVSVTFIHDTAFDGCPKLNIIAEENSYAYEWFKRFKRYDVNIVDLEENNNLIDIDDFYDEVKPGDYIGETVIVGRNAVFFIDNSDISVNEKNGNVSRPLGDLADKLEGILGEDNNLKGYSLPKFTIIDSTIAGKAFYADKSLTEYEIGSDIDTIGDFAFARSSLNSIKIPSSVKNIGYGAFYHCDNLSDVSIPDSVTKIEPSAFEHTKYLDNFMSNSSSDFLIVGDGILLAYKGHQTIVNIPDGVKQIGPGAFKNHEEAVEVILPDSLVKICEEAFYGCRNLTSIKEGMNLETIEDRAFYACPLSTVRIVESVKEVGLSAFDFEDTKLNNAYRCVVFQGNKLPEVAYTKTTSRLSNPEYRNDSFNDLKIAIVQNGNIEVKDTVLDKDKSGFSGLICTIEKENDEYFNGSLKIIGCTLSKSEAETFDLPKTVYIYGKGYNLDEEELAFILNRAKNGEFETVKEGNTTSVNGSSEEFLLNIYRLDDSSSSLKEGYKRIYGDTIPGNLTSYNIELIEKNSGVYISKLGALTKNIALKLPENIASGNIHIITTDEYGQLEDIAYRKDASNDAITLSFDINHTGEYGIYSVDIGANLSYDLDETPDTGEHFDPKWFLAIGLISVGLALILINGRRKVR